MTGAQAPPAPAPDPPRRSPSESLQLTWHRVQRSSVVPVTLAALAALVLGILAGRASAPTVDTQGIDVVARDLVPLAVDIDALWTSGRGDLPAVGVQLYQLRRDDDPGVVTPYVDAWFEAYDGTIRRMIGVEVPPAVRPVHRQLVGAAALNLDAVELVAAAAAAEDPALRRELSSEAVRLRIRAEAVTQAAQASLRDLQGGPSSGVSEPRRLPGLAELR